MVNRRLRVDFESSFFLFGPRGTGKTSLLKQLFPDPSKVLWIDLLKEDDEDSYRKTPQLLSEILNHKRVSWVVIDEVQKNPKLLDIAHFEIQKKRCKFALTGSSARKLRRGSANLLAGRALTYQLFPFTADELGDLFHLDAALSEGTLPGLLEHPSPEGRWDYLRSYVTTYLKEEIISEQLVRKVDPFRDFLPVAAQCNGTILNFSKIGKDIGVDDKTVHSYFKILEDTLVGFPLPPYHRSVRKRQRESSKFYLFDTGVKRALDKTLRVPLLPQTYAYGHAFEHWIILEVFRLNEYRKLDYSLSYLRTKDDAEIDLIIERPGDKTLLVEIKSTTAVNETDTRSLQRFLRDWPGKAEAQIWSLDTRERKIDRVILLPWQQGLRQLV